MTLTYRAVKGSALTATEFDGNIYDLDGRVHTLETNPPSAVGISNITVVGSQFTVYLSNGTHFGPFTLPVVTSAWRGPWNAATAYSVLDLVTVSGQGIYYVLRAHTSAATFDPAATDGVGFLYQLAYGDAGSPPVSTITDVAFAATRDHASHYNRCTSDGDGSGLVVITLNMGIFSVGDEMHYRQSGNGTLSVVAGASVTINGVTGFLNKTLAKGGVITVKCVAANTFDIFGLLASV